MLETYPWCGLFAVVLGYHGFRSGSLSGGGAATAALLGYLTLATPLKTFAVSLLTFYFAGSRITKVPAPSSSPPAPLANPSPSQVNARYKAQLSDPEHSPSSPTPRKAGGNRSSAQVCSNALFGTLCAVAWRVLFSGELADPTNSRRGQLWSLARPPCALQSGKGFEGWSSVLLLGAVSFWSACAGDTFASELGILSRSAPVSVLTLRTVPRGTNGGVSVWGLFMSLVGGLVVGVAAVVSLALEQPACSGAPLTFGDGSAGRTPVSSVCARLTLVSSQLALVGRPPRRLRLVRPRWQPRRFRPRSDMSGDTIFPDQGQDRAPPRAVPRRAAAEAWAERLEQQRGERCRERGHGAERDVVGAWEGVSG